MKQKSLLKRLLPSTILLINLPLTQLPSEAVTPRFFCARLNGTWTTFANSTQGKVPLIEWVSGNFDVSGWSNQKRCVIVSERFNSFNNQGQLSYLKTGTINNLPVICGVKINQGKCSDGNVLVTLKAGTNADDTLRQLLDTRTRGSGKPISLSNHQLYSYDKEGELVADIDNLIQALPPVADKDIQEIQTPRQLRLQPSSHPQPQTQPERVW